MLGKGGTGVQSQDGCRACFLYHSACYNALCHINNSHHLFRAYHVPIRIVLSTLKAHLVLLCFALLCFTDAAYFLQIEGLWQPCIEFIGTSFPTTFAHLVSLCHILVILAMLQSFHQQKHYDSLKAQMMVSIF